MIDSSWNGIDSWVMNTADTIYNVYRNMSIDTTVEMNFVFWIRSRDDAKVADLTPAFKTNLRVIEPRFERDVGIIDFTTEGWPTSRVASEADSFWVHSISNWNENVVFDITKDKGSPTLDFLLKHKVVILYNDAIKSGGLADNNEQRSAVVKAIDAGVNMWATWRAPIASNNLGSLPMISPPADLGFYFAIRKTVYSGWICYDFGLNCPYIRFEDFVGAYSLDSTEWPNINLTADLLQSRYNWNPWNFPGMDYIDSLPCLPEVNWSEASFGAEVLYLYKSIYGPNHPLGTDFEGFDYVMEGAPVGHRFNSGLFRTVHFNFTPLAIDTTTGSSSTGDGLSEAQSLVNHVLDWLYDPSLTAPVSRLRYPGSKLKLSVAEQRRKYWERNDRMAREEGLLPDIEEQPR